MRARLGVRCRVERPGVVDDDDVRVLAPADG
jgi:hypothetical protein